MAHARIYCHLKASPYTRCLFCFVLIFVEANIWQYHRHMRATKFKPANYTLAVAPKGILVALCLIICSHVALGRLMTLLFKFELLTVPFQISIFCMQAYSFPYTTRLHITVVWDWESPGWVISAHPGHLLSHFGHTCAPSPPSPFTGTRNL